MKHTAKGESKIEDDFQVLPGTDAGTVDKPFQFVKQLLGPADAESRHVHRTAIFQGAIDGGFQPGIEIPAIIVATIDVGVPSTKLSDEKARTKQIAAAKAVPRGTGGGVTMKLFLDLVEAFHPT